MSDERDRLARVALNRLAEPGETRLASLVHELGAVRVHEHLSAERDLEGVLTDVAARLEGIDPARDLERAERCGLRFLVPGDEEWPSRLDDLHAVPPIQARGGGPIGLWVRGPLHLGEVAASVAVVGSRSATSYGGAVARDLAAEVARAGLAVVSGAAYGIDQAAHRGGLAAGGTSVAVLACGADKVYPSGHRNLIEHLSAHGAVVSEAAPGCAPTRVRFLARNRLIAALTRGTVVVEAAARSGALNTANWAERLNRHLMGVPGPVTAPQSEGVHQLVRLGAATLVTGGADVLEVVGAAGQHLVVPPRGRTRSRDHLTIRQQQVLDAVPVTRGAPTDSVARAAGIGLVEVRRTLEALGRHGLVDRDGDGWLLSDHARD